MLPNCLSNNCSFYREHTVALPASVSDISSCLLRAHDRGASQRIRQFLVLLRAHDRGANQPSLLVLRRITPSIHNATHS
jgi:hypothetical protein